MASVSANLIFGKKPIDRKMNQNRRMGKIGGVVLTCWLVSRSWQTIGSQWLGEHRDGVWREHDIVEKFPNNGLPVIWRQPLGGGYPGPAVADGRVLVMDREAEAFAPETAAGEFQLRPGKNSGNGALDLFGRIHRQKLWQTQYEGIYSTALFLRDQPAMRADGGRQPCLHHKP